MERYDYRTVMYDDIQEYIEENYDLQELYNEYDGNKDDVYEKLFDEMWVADSVTGNGSGSYFFNAWKAEEAICHNFDLYQEANEEFGNCPFKGAETADVTIRCYLLGEILGQVLDDMTNEKGINYEE